MTTEAAKEIAEKIVSHFQLTITIMFEYFENAIYHCVFSVQNSFEEQATQRSFVPHGRQDVLAAAIGCPEHPGRVRAAGAGVTIKQYYGSAPWTSHSASSLPPDKLQQLTQQIRDQLEESIIEKVTRQIMASLSQLQSQMCGLYIEADPARLVAVGRVYEGSTLVHNTPLLPGQVKVSVDEVKDADAPVPVPTTEVRRDVTVFGVVNPDFPLYIKHEDLSEITDGGQCLSISVLQLWILHLNETCMRVGNSDIYGFLEPQSIQRFHCSGHWQMVVILPKEHLVVWFCSLHNRPDNYLKGIINSAIKGLDDAPHPKSKAPAKWIVVKYFNDPRPLESERLKALRIPWAQFYLRVRDQA
ncbi:hypothetical protein HKD37_14G039695 [Glycine soja]